MRRLSLLALLLALPAMGQGYLPSSRPVSPETVQASLVGEPIAARTLTLAGDGTYTSDALIFHSGQLRLVPTTVTATGYMRWNSTIEGFDFGKALIACAGCDTYLDKIVPRQASIPVTIGDADGTTFACQASPGTCDAAHKGAVVCVSESATSATRLCRCILTQTAGNYRWLNMDNATRGAGTTDCPDTTP